MSAHGIEVRATVGKRNRAWCDCGWWSSSHEARGDAWSEGVRHLWAKRGESEGQCSAESIIAAPLRPRAGFTNGAVRVSGSSVSNRPHFDWTHGQLIERVEHLEDYCSRQANIIAELADQLALARAHASRRDVTVTALATDNASRGMQRSIADTRCGHSAGARG